MCEAPGLSLVKVAAEVDVGAKVVVMEWNGIASA